MSRASELFCNRRSRFGRNGHVSDLGFGSSLERNRHHSFGRRLHGHHRRDSDGCDLLLRSPHLRHARLASERVSHFEREPVRLNDGISHSGSENSTNIAAPISGLRLTGNGRLPGTVLLARERLLQRLRGVSLSETSASSTDHRARSMISYSLRLDDSGDIESETSTETFSGPTPMAELTSQLEHLQLSQQSKKNPPGLTQDALDSLSLEVFRSAEQCTEKGAPRASRDCSICLESFTDGEKLICLPCAHRFHPACLNQWIRDCGNCPYCRGAVFATCH